MTTPRLNELLGDGARADGFEELTRFLDGLVTQRPVGLSDEEASYIRLLKIMATAATEGANQEWSQHGRPTAEIALGLCRSAGFAVASAVLSVNDNDADLKNMREAIMYSIGLGVDYMIDHVRKHDH